MTIKRVLQFIGTIVTGLLSVLALMSSQSATQAQENITSYISSPLLGRVVAWLYGVISTKSFLALCFFVIGGFAYHLNGKWRAARITAEPLPHEVPLGPVFDAAHKQGVVTLDQLKYAVRETERALLDTGDLREDDYRRNTLVLEREHAVWHREALYDLRTVFLYEARDAYSSRVLRTKHGIATVGDYDSIQVRDRHEARLRETSADLRQALDQVPRDRIIR